MQMQWAPQRAAGLTIWGKGVTMSAGEERTVVKTHYDGAVGLLEVVGELTSAAEEPVVTAYDALATQPVQGVVLDFAQATTINSAGVALVLRLVTESGRRNQRVAFSGLNQRFATLFRMVGLLQSGPMHHSAADAVAAMNNQQ